MTAKGGEYVKDTDLNGWNNTEEIERAGLAYAIRTRTHDTRVRFNIPTRR